MFQLFQNIFGSGADAKDHYPESLVTMAIERALEGTDARMRLLPGYAKKLRAPVLHAMNHVVDMVARLPAPANGRVMLVTAADTLRMPSHALLPSDFRGNLASTVAQTNRRRVAAARAQLDNAANSLRAAGWRNRGRGPASRRPTLARPRPTGATAPCSSPPRCGRPCPGPPRR